MKDVNGKVAFVTGGASGIGFGIVRTFLAAGMKVVVADIRQDRLDEAAAVLPSDAKVRFIRLDVTDRAAFAAAAGEAERVFGKVHVVCNNAGVGPLINASKVTYDDWDWTMAVNVGGIINGVQTFLPRLLAHDEEAHIVNTTSIAGVLPMPDAIAYVTSKYAVTGLTEGLRADLGSAHRIAVTLLVPGPVVTNIHEVAKLRPEKYGATGAKQAETEMLQRKAPSTWMDPLDAGAMVLDGIQRRLPYVITHGQFKAGTKSFYDAVLTGFPPVPPAEERADLGFGVTNPIYDEILAAAQPPARRRPK